MGAGERESMQDLECSSRTWGDWKWDSGIEGGWDGRCDVFA